MMLAWFSSSERMRTPGPAERAEDAEVGGEPGREADGGLGPLPLGQLLLELAVDGTAAGDQARGPGAGAPAGEGTLRRPPRRPGAGSDPDSRWRRRTRPAPPSSRPVGPEGVELPGRAPASLVDDPGQRGADAVVPGGVGHVVAPGGRRRGRAPAPGRPVPRRERRPSARSRSAVIVSGGMSTTTSPSGPQQHAPGHRAGAHPATPAQPRRRAAPAPRRPSAHAGAPRAPRADPPTVRSSSEDNCSARARTFANTSHASIRRRCSSATAAANAFPP